MKIFIPVFAAIVLMMSGYQSQAAIACVPGDCCNGRPCGSNPNPNPPRGPDCPPRGGRPLFLNVKVSGTCSSVQVQDCSACASYANACTEHHDKAGDFVGYACVYCQ